MKRQDAIGRLEALANGLDTELTLIANRSEPRYDELKKDREALKLAVITLKNVVTLPTGPGLPPGEYLATPIPMHSDDAEPETVLHREAEVMARKVAERAQGGFASALLRCTCATATDDNPCLIHHDPARTARRFEAKPNPYGPGPIAEAVRDFERNKPKRRTED